MFAQTETVYPTGLKIGDKAPDFQMADQNGKKLHLANLLKQGPVVLVFIVVNGVFIVTNKLAS